MCRFILLVVACLVFVVSCASPPPVPLSAEEVVQRDSALAMLEQMQRTAFDEAFDQLGGFTYERTRVVQEIGEDDRLSARLMQTVRVSGAGEARTVSALAMDSSGVFRRSVFSGLVERSGAESDTTALGPLILPEDPPYLSGRGREAFRFQILPDTVVDERPTRAVLIEARPGEGDGQQLRRVRLYIDRATDQLVIARVVRTQNALLYREQSAFDFRLIRLDSGPWIPHTLSVDTQIGSPAFAERRYQTTTTYEVVD